MGSVSIILPMFENDSSRKKAPTSGGPFSSNSLPAALTAPPDSLSSAKPRGAFGAARPAWTHTGLRTVAAGHATRYRDQFHDLL